MFGKSFTLFRLLGFPIRVDLSWTLLALLITWSLAGAFFPWQWPGQSTQTYWWMGAAGALLLFASIILHELGHAVVARRYHIPIKGITLFVFGGVAQMEDEPPTAKSELHMALAGPAVSVVLALLFQGVYMLATQTGQAVGVRGVFAYGAWMNLILAIFNLLPAFPLDGGRVLRALLWKRKKNLVEATRIASAFGSGFGLLLILLGFFAILSGNPLGGVWRLLIGMFLREAASASYQQVRIRAVLEGLPVSAVMRHDPVVVPPSITVEELVQEYVYRYHHELFPVMRNSDLLGSVDLREVKDVPRREWSRWRVADVMRDCSSENTVDVATETSQLFRTMTRSGHTRYMVTENGHLAGIVTLKDLIAFLALKFDLEGESTSGRPDRNERARVNTLTGANLREREP